MDMKRPLKIGLVCDDSLDKTDGVQQYVLTLGNWLTNAGHEVHYLTSTTKRTDLSHIHSLSRNMHVKFNNNHNGMPLPASSREVRELLDREQFDVLHIQMPYSPLLAGKIIRMSPKKTTIIGTFHVFPHNALMKYGTRLLGLYVRRQLKRFAMVISVSSAAQVFAKQSFGINTTVIPNMVEVSRFMSNAPARPAPTKTVTIAFLGRLVARKGCMQLLKALHVMQAQYPPKHKYVVRIGGKGPLLSGLQEFAKRNNMQNITFEGFIAEEAKQEFLATADVAVFPSTGGESFGISLIEAMAASPGVVIAGDNEGYRTVMTGAEQQLVRPNDSVAFAQLLRSYIDSASMRNSAHAWQINHVKLYDTETICPQIVDAYRKSIASTQEVRDNT